MRWALAGLGALLALAACAPPLPDMPDETAARTERVLHHWPAGSKKSETEGYRRDGRFVHHGLARRWHAGGRLEEEGRHEHGRPVGIWTTRYPDGSRSSVTHWRDGVRHGPSVVVVDVIGLHCARDSTGETEEGTPTT